MKYLVLASTLTLSACSNSPVSCDVDFGKKVAEALSAGNVDKVVQMYHLEGVDDLTLETVKNVLQHSAGKEVATVNIVALPEDFPLEYKMYGNKYEINLAPTKQLKIQFADEKSNTDGLLKTSMGLPLGMHNGQCRIASAAKVSR